MHTNHKSRCKGVTLVEILLVLGVLAIVFSFAVPSIGSANTRMTMRAAAEHVEYSIKVARDTARLTESDVRMNVLTDPDTGQSIITFTLSAKSLKKLSQPELQEYHLENSLTLHSDKQWYEFDSRGVVKNPGQITLVALEDQSLTESFLVE